MKISNGLLSALAVAALVSPAAMAKGARNSTHLKATHARTHKLKKGAKAEKGESTVATETAKVKKPRKQSAKRRHLPDLPS